MNEITLVNPARYIDEKIRGVVKRDALGRPEEDEKADIILNDAGSN